jgi:hypothetical protein
MYSYPDLAINNAPCIENRIFTRLLEPDESKWNQVDQITQEQLNKVKMGLNFLHYTRMDACQKYAEKMDWTRERDIDVFWAGTTDYGDGTALGQLVTAHRKECLEVLKGIKGLKVIAEDGRVFERTMYYDMLSRAKVTVSPFGWGEACYREYEAAMLGCICIKPVMEKFIEGMLLYVRHVKLPLKENLEKVIRYCIDHRKALDKITKVASSTTISKRFADYKAYVVGDIITQITREKENNV